MYLKKNPRQETKTVWDHAVRCDICKEEIRTKMYERQDVEIRANIGDAYPESDSSTCYRVDCCGKCFLEKVKPLLESELGIDFQETDSDEGYLSEEVR